jgi:hypothetical protein
MVEHKELVDGLVYVQIYGLTTCWDVQTITLEQEAVEVVTGLVDRWHCNFNLCRKQLTFGDGLGIR